MSSLAGPLSLLVYVLIIVIVIAVIVWIIFKLTPLFVTAAAVACVAPETTPSNFPLLLAHMF